MRKDLPPDRFGDQRERTDHHRVGDGERDHDRQNDGQRADAFRKHIEERIEIVDGGQRAVRCRVQKISALSEIAEQQADLDKRPAGPCGIASGMPHIGVKCFGAGHGQENAAQQFDAGVIQMTEQKLYAERRIKCP